MTRADPWPGSGSASRVDLPRWRGDFYPKGLAHRLELAYAAARMSSVEVNGSFYSLQRPSSLPHVGRADA